MLRKLKEKFSIVKSNKKALIIYIVLTAILIASFTVLPVYLWTNSDVWARGVASIRGDSMLPTVADNDILYVKEVEFERGEIVVARCPKNSSYYTNNLSLMKRVVGLPGEIVEMTNDGVLINGELLDEPYAGDISLTLNENNNINEIHLSNNEYFLLGDSRGNSFDSRHVGAVHSNDFVYALTLEPNDYTRQLSFKLTAVVITNIAGLIVFPMFLIYLMAAVIKVRDRGYIIQSNISNAGVHKKSNSGKKNNSNKKKNSGKSKMYSKAMAKKKKKK